MCAKEKSEIREPIILKNGEDKIFGVLHLPVNRQNKVPGIIICHGLAGEKTGKHRVYVDLAYNLSQMGIATLRFDYRGCGDSECEFINITPEEHYSDTEVCLDYLSKHPDIDAERIGIFGRSFGGVVAVRAASKSGMIKSIALWCPMFNGEQWQDQWQLLQSDAVEETVRRKMLQVNSQQGSYRFFDQFFNIDVVDDLLQLKHVPLLHIHGEVDTRVNLNHAHEYEKHRKDAPAESKFLKLPNTDHDFSDVGERDYALEQTLDWFSKTL